MKTSDPSAYTDFIELDAIAGPFVAAGVGFRGILINTTVNGTITFDITTISGAVRTVVVGVLANQSVILPFCGNDIIVTGVTGVSAVWKVYLCN